MTIVRKRFRRIRIAAIVVLVVLVVPYLFSRLASSARRVSVHSGAAAIRADVVDNSLKIACYNIAHGRGLATSNWEGGSAQERKTRLDEIAELLREIDADIVVLNEVDFDCRWSDSVNQAEYLAQKAGYGYWAEERNFDFRVLWWTWRFGNAVLSKHPIDDAQVIDFLGLSTVETLLAGKTRAARKNRLVRS